MPQVDRDAAALEAHTTSEHFEGYVIEQSIPVLVDRERHVYDAIDV
jgi:quinol monooxygenase YgiN